MYGNFLGSENPTNHWLAASSTNLHLGFWMDGHYHEISMDSCRFLGQMIEANKNQVTFDGSPQIVYNNEGNKKNDSSH